jgi:thiamine biosynthesis lipoprotein
MGGLWDFKTQSPRIPALSDIKKRLRLIDYKSIVVDGSKGVMRLAKKGMRIGLGAIAKGYAVDRASAVLLDRGFKDFIVYGGGDLRVSGSKAGRPFSVGIQDPRNRNRYFARFDMETEGAVVTSGDYESFFVLNGQRYHHIIDPETGFPAKGTVSVTVLDKTATRADALATGIFAMGPEKGMQLIEAQPTLEGVIVDEEFNVHVSTGLRSRLVMTPIDVPKEKDQL